MKDFLANVLTAIIVTVVVILLIVGIIFGVCVVPFNCNKAVVNVYLNQEVVYSGRDVYVQWEQLGENGNKYQVTVWERTYVGYVLKIVTNRYVGEDFYVENL